MELTLKDIAVRSAGYAVEYCKVYKEGTYVAGIHQAEFLVKVGQQMGVKLIIEDSKHGRGFMVRKVGGA
jgi:hypothetical protein